MVNDWVLTALLIAGVGWIVSLYFEQRSKLRREVVSLLRATEVVFEETGKVFKGADAKILLQDYVSLGTSDTGPILSAKFLCKTPDLQIVSVLVETAHGDVQAAVNVSLLDSKEIDAVLAMYPYLSRLRKELGAVIR